MKKVIDDNISTHSVPLIYPDVKSSFSNKQEIKEDLIIGVTKQNLSIHSDNTPDTNHFNSELDDLCFYDC